MYLLKKLARLHWVQIVVKEYNQLIRKKHKDMDRAEI